MHGVSRLPHLAVFVDHTKTMFVKTWLPLPVATMTGYAIPFVEVALGALLISGLFLRPVLVVGLLFMFMLTFGLCLAQNWAVASEQLIYMIALALLLAGARYHRFALRRVCRETRFPLCNGDQIGSKQGSVLQIGVSHYWPSVR